MADISSQIEIARRVVVETAHDFHFRAVTEDGRQIEAPIVYQIEEPGFRPYRAGKASAEELQAELDRIIGLADQRGVNMGIEGIDSVRKLASQMGYGVDCSNFAFRTLDRIHDTMGLQPYTQTVFRLASEIRELHATKKPSWDAKDKNGNTRNLTDEELAKLESSDLLDIDWITEVFGKDPEFIIGSAHMTDDHATEQVEPTEVLPGDLIAFTKAGAGVVSHVCVVEQAEVSDKTAHIDFWHSWHTRDFESGIRRDSVTVEADLTMRWSHEGLEDPKRYEGYSFRRPAEIAVAYAHLG
jgi:hypothetical protein